MKKNYLLVFITTFLLTFISVAYAAFNSELTISGSGIVEKDTTPPTCGTWYLRDSNLTIQEAYNQNKFTNPSTNTSWTTTNQKLFIECSDNMPGSYGCIDVTEITDSNNNPRYFKEVKEYTTSIKTDSEVITVKLKDAYLNERTCTLPVGGSNPYIDKQAPVVTITPTAANKFTYSATDDLGVTGYQVTTNSTQPTTWLTTPAEVTIDNTAAKTYYVWAKDGVNVSYQTINTYLLTRTQGTGTTLTLKYKNNSGATLASSGTQYVLNGTQVYSVAAPNTGYNTVVLKKGTTTVATGSGTNSVNSTITVSSATTISSSATPDSYTATFYYNSDSTSGSMSIATATAECTISGSNTSCNATIPDEVKNSVGKYNSEFLGVSASLNNGTSAGTTTVSLNGNKNFYAFYSSPVSIYYQTGTMDTTTGAISNLEASIYEYYRNEYITNVTSGSEAMSAVINSTQTATSNFTFASSVNGYSLFGFRNGANSTTRTHNTVALAATSDVSTFYAILRKKVNATIYYNSGTGDGTLILATATTSGYRYTYCSNNSTANVSNGNHSIPNTVSSSVGQYGTKYLNTSNAVNSMSAIRRTAASTTSKGADITVLYAIYQGNDVSGTKTDVTNYYYDGSYKSRTLYRNSFFTSVTGSGAMTTVLSTSTTGKTNYSTAVGPGNSVWSGLSNAQDTTAEHASVAAAAISTDLSLYTVYTMNITYEKGSNVSTIGKNSDSCKLTTDSTSCDVTLPTITANTGYTSVGWSTTNGDTTGVTGTYSNSSNTTKLYANATANAYTIAYAMNNGANPNPKPTTGTYGSNVSIGTTTMPTKTVTITGDANGTGATIGSATVNTQTFGGWTSSSSAGLQGNAQSGSTTSNLAAWNGSSTTNKYFKNLRNASGTVTLTATWSGTSTLPTVTKTGYTCSWYDTNGTTGGNLVGTSGGSYTVPSNSATTMTIYARCTPNTYTVTANANGGSIATTTGWTGTGNTSTKSVTYDTPYDTLPTATKTGYTFQGWTGKNLVNIADQNISFTNNYYIGQGSNTNYILEPNTTYTLSFDYVVYSASQNIFASIGYGSTNFNKDLKQGSAYSGTGKMIVTFTTPETFETGTSYEPPYVWFRLVRMGTKGDANVDVSNIQFEKGSTATPYEPYYITPETILTTASDHIITAKWVDDTPPTKPTVTLKFADNSGTYTSGTWTNKQVITQVSSTEEGSGITSIPYNYAGTWTTGHAVTQSGTTYSKIESWTVTDGRNVTVVFKAIDADGNESLESDSVNIKYDISGPTITASNITYGSNLSITLADAYSGVTGWQVTSSSTAPTSGWTAVTKTASTTVTKSGLAAGTYYIWAKDDLGNTNSKQITVNRQGIAFPTCSDKAYTASEQTLFDAHTSGSYTNNAIKGTTVGGYTGALTPTSNYQWNSGSDVTAARILTCNIVKSNTTTTGNNITQTYTGNAVSGTASAKLNSNNTNISGAAFTYTYYNGSSCGGTALSSAPTSWRDGGYSYTATLTGTANYNTSTSECKTIVINKAANPMTFGSTQSGSVTFSTSAQNKVFTAAASAQGNVTYSITSQKQGSTGVTYFSIPTDSTASMRVAANTPSGTYTIKINAHAAGGTNYNTKDLETTYTLTIGPAPCKLAVSNPANKNPDDTYDLSTLVTANAGTVTYALKSGGSNTTTPSTLSGSTLTVGAMSSSNDTNQSVDVQFTDPGSNDYEGCTIEKSVTVKKKTNTLAANNQTVYVSSTTALSSFIKNNNGGTVSYTKGTDNTSGSSISGSNFVAGTLAANDDANKTVTITATSARTTKVAASGNVTITVTVQKYTRGLTLTINPVNVKYNKTASLSTSNTGSGGTPGTSVTYTSSNTSVFTVTGSTIKAIKSSGTSDITATRAGSTTVKAATATATATATQDDCQLTISNTSMTTGSNLDLTTVATNAVGEVTFAIKTNGTTTASTLSGSTLTAGAMSTANDNAQTVVVTATEAATTNYNSCSKDISITVNKQTNTLAADNKTVYVSSSTALSNLTKNNNGGSLSASITTDNTAGSSISGTNFDAGVLGVLDDSNKTVVMTVTSARTATVAQKSVTVTATVQKYTRALTITTPTANQEVEYNKTITAASTNGGSGGTPGAVTYSSSDTSIFTVTGTTIKAIKSSGTATIGASRAGSTTVKAATATGVTISAKKATNPMTFTTPQSGSVTFSTSAQNKAFTAAASAQGTVTYSITSQSIQGGAGVTYFSIPTNTTASMSVAANTPVGTYTIVIKASAAGNTNYNVLELETTYTLTVGKKKATIALTDSSKALTYPTAGTNTYTYDGAATPTCSSSNTEYVTCSVDATNHKITVTPVKPTSSAVTITVSATEASGSNYSSPDNKTFTVTVAKGTLTATATALNGTYSGSAQYAKIKVTKSDWDGATIVSGTTTSYGQSVTTSGVYNTNYNLKPGYTNVTSSTTIYYKITGGTYYNDLTGSTTAKINQKKATITLTDTTKALTYPTAGTNTYTYDGDGTVSCSSSDTTYVTCSVDATNHKITVTPVKPTSSAVAITVSAGNGTNYSAADNKTFTVTVAKGTLTATATALNGTYSGSAQYAKIKVTKSDWDGGTIVSGTTTSYGQSVTTSGVYNTNYNLKPGYTNVTSSTTIYYKITGGTYYNDLTGSTTAAIGQKKATITLTDATKALTYPTVGTNAYTYDGDGTLSCTSSDTAYVTCSVDTTNHVITVTPVKPTSTAVTITLSATAGTNYSAPDNKTFTVTVAKGTLTATATALNGTYSGSAQYAKIKVTKSDWDGGTIVSGTTTSYGQSVTTSGVYNTNYNLKPGYTNVTSSTTIYYKITGGTYYNDLTGSTTATIGKKKATITLTDSSKALTYPSAGSNTYTYDGTATPTCTSSSTTYVTCTVDATNHKITVTPVKPTTSAVTITVSATEASGSNYSSPDNKTFTVTVAKGTCPAPTNVAIASNKKVSWTNASGASSYEISMSASSGFTAHTNNTAYNSITDSTGSRTVYVRSVCDTNYYSSANSSNASATTTVYSVSLTKGTGISSVSGGGNYITGASASIDATVSSGYTWSNWTGTSTISNKSTSVTVDNNKSYTANATPNTYSISLDNQGATSAGTTIAYYQYKTTKVINGTTCYYYTDDTLTTCLASGYLITNPTKTGYTFGGYYTSTGGSGTNYINSSGSFVNNIYQKLPSEINSNYTDQITLYAKWTANTYTIAYSMNNGNNPNPKPTSGTYNSDVVIGSTTMPTKTVTFTGNANGTGASVGSAAVSTQTFTGWTSSTSAGLGSGAKTGTSASPSTAWTGTSTTNKYFRNLRDTSGTVTLTANWSGTATLPTVTKEGYTCKWYDTEGTTGGNLIGNSGGSYTVPSASATAVTLYARCTINSYTLTINPNNGTFNGTTSNTTVTQNYGTTYNVANNPTRAGYIFAGWKLTSGDGNVTYFQDSEKLQQYLINSTSANKPGVYNNKGNGTVTHTLQADSTSSTGYSMKIVTNGEASPGAGGFVNSVSATAGAIYYHKIVAKVPTGYTINMASNSGGVGYGSYWLTSNAGTGDWATYIYIQYDGYNGPFSNFGHVYVSGSNNQSVTWYINESTIYRKGSTLAEVQASNIVFGFKASNATLTAQWSQSGATVTWDKQGGTFGNGTIGNKWTANSTAFRYLQDLSATKKAPYYISDSDFAIYKDGYVFDGFYTTANTGGTQIFDATGKLKASVSGYSDANRKWQKYDSNVTLYARWIPNVVTVNLKNGTAASTKAYSVSLSNSSTTDSGTYTGTNSTGTVTFSGVPNGTYYVWSGKNSNALSTRLYTGQSVTVNSNSPSAVTVQYYTLTLSKGTGISAVSNAGTSTTSSVEHLYNASDKQNIAIDATVSSGYTWSTWTASGTTPTTYTATTKNQNIKMGAGAVTLTASATYTATPTITRNDYNTFTVSATAGSKYIISKTITSKPAADNSAWSTTTTKDVSTTAKETWYVWVMDANNNVSNNYATITNYKVTLTASTGTTISAVADTASSTNTVTNNSYVLANTPVFPTGALNTGYESLVVKKGSTTITNGSSQTITADTTFSSSATVTTYTIGYTLNGGSVSPANPTSYTIESSAITLTNPTKTGYTFTGWTGSNGTTPQTSVTIASGSTGNKTYTANYTIDDPATPTISGNGGRVYNYAGRTLTCATTTTYASGTSIYYQFGYATSTSNWTSDSITWIGSASTTATYDVAKNEYIGTRYYGCRVYASDGTSTSGTIKSTSVAQSFVNSRLFFDVDTNGGTRSGSANLYVPYGLTNIYTGRTNQTSGTIPTATKTGYTFNGWYTASSGGSQVINASGVVQASVSGWTDANKKWLRTSSTNNDTVNPLYAQFTANTYTIAYAMNYGGNPNPKPTTGTYDSDVVIGSTTMPTKSITVTGNANNSGATVGSATVNSQTFNGWTSSTSAGLGSGAKTGTSASPSTAWTGTSTTNKYFRNLRDTSGTVTLTANWSGNITLPTLSKTNNICNWYASDAATEPIGASGESIPVASNSSTSITVYAKCVQAHYKIGNNYYVTLADALDAASATGTTIQVIDDHTDTSIVSIDSSKITSVTLNTSGKTITRNGNQITVGSGVTLNITGSGGISFTGDATGGKLINNGTVYLTNATLTKTSVETVHNNGTFYMNSGKISTTDTGSYNAVYNDTTGKFYFVNGDIEIKTNGLFYYRAGVENHGTFGMSGGTINNLGDTNYGIANYGTGVVNMSGGTIYSKGTAPVAITNVNGTATININGGTINAEGIGLCNEAVDGTGVINLNSGTIIANIGIMHRGGTINVGSNSTLSTTNPSIQANTGVSRWAGSSVANFYNGEIISDSPANAIVGDYTTRTGYVAYTEDYQNNTYRTYLKQGLAVSLYPNGGTVSPSIIYTLNGREYGNLPTPTKANNIFNGWYIEYSDTEALAYIESDGNQYIDTGVPANTIYGIDFTYMPVGNVSGYDSYLSGLVDNFTLGRYNNNAAAYIRHRGTEITHALSVSTTDPNRLEIKNGKAKQGNQSFNVTTTNPISTNSANLIIGNNSGLNRGSKIRIYGLTLYDANGDVMKRFIPAIDQWNTSETYGQVGMYETVSGTFYPNNGSGDFVSGGKRYVTSTTICDEQEDHTLTADWTPAVTVTFDASGGSVSPSTKQVPIGGKYGDLPTPTGVSSIFTGWAMSPATDYIELEYIESTGTQYINTGISTSNTFGVYAKMMGIDMSTESVYFGANQSKAWNMLRVKSGKYYFDWRTKDGTGTSITNTGITEIEFNYYNSRTVKVDGTSVKSLGSGIGITSTPMFIFATNSSGTASSFSSMRLYELVMTNNTSTINRNFIPVKKISTGAVGLYDKKNNVFYGNQGTGEFIAGPIKYVTSNTNVELTTDHRLVAVWSNEIEYGYTGDVQTFTAPVAGTYLLEVCGAQGGTASNNIATREGGKGGCASGTVSLSAGQTLYVFVGGQGNMSTGGTSNAGGYNGGGDCTATSSSDLKINGTYLTTNASGGGATHISKSNTSIANAGNNLLIVGGGGGGAHTYVSRPDGSSPLSLWFSGTGGNGGGSSGANGTKDAYDGRNHGTIGYGGTQSAGGSTGGSLGQGGTGSGGGGGGYYGGGGSTNSAGGGGGSGYIGGVSSGTWTSTSCANSSNYRTGNGCAKITKQ